MSIVKVKKIASEIVKSENLAEKRKLDFLGMVPCPIKPKFHEFYEKTAKEYFLSTGRALYAHVPLECGCQGTEGEKRFVNILDIPSIDMFPDLVAAFSFMDFFNSGFQSRFFSKGYFRHIPTVPLNRDFQGLGLEDPDGDFNIYSVFPTVIMVDKRKLGNLPVPKSFGDLLDPVYKGQITIPSGHGTVSSLFPMYILKEFGEAGLQALDDNVGNILHGAKMAKIAGTMNSECTPIYVITWFFAKTCAQTQYVDIIWPEDGAYIDPMYLIAKKELPQESELLLNMLTGADFSGFLAENFFPTANGMVDNRLPQGAKMKWIGWHFLKNNKIEELTVRIEKIFDKHIKPEYKN
jgi:ABC-type Fe3+ transport system substrate-binding protein